jgi:broad specificity phosphatase PhoE
MTLYLVRHGQAEAGVEHVDPGLDAVGRQQAEYAALALEKIYARRLVVSPLRRARETAEPIAARLRLEPEIRNEVAEVFDPSMPVDERQSMLGTFLSGHWPDRDQRLRQWRQDVVSTLLELGASGDPVVVVSHFVAISVAVGEATGDVRVSPCPLGNASITTVDVNGGRLVLRHAGDIAHLPREIVSVRAPRAGPQPG